MADYKGAPYIKEDGKSFKENAVKKAVKIARFTGRLTLGEDSGLEVDALDGRPGIYSSRFSGRDKSNKLWYPFTWRDNSPHSRQHDVF